MTPTVAIAVVFGGFLLLAGAPLAGEEPTTGEGAIRGQSPDLERLPLPVRQQIEGLERAIVELEEARPRAIGALSSGYGSLGHLYTSYEMWDAATSVYTRAADIEPGLHRWPYFLGHVAEARGRLGEAAALFAHALELTGSDLETRLRLGEAQLSLGNPEAARATFEEARRRRPTLPAAWYGLGRAASAVGDAEAAVEAFERARELEPGDSTLYYALAFAYRSTGRLDDARAAMERYSLRELPREAPLAAELDRIGTIASYELLKGLATDEAGFPPERLRGYALSLLSAVDGAADELAAELAVLPSSGGPAPRTRARLRYATAMLYVQRARDGEARNQLEAALAEAPDLAAARLELGNLLARSGELGAAVAELSRLLDSEPRHLSAHLRRATALMRLERWGDAALDLERQIELDPSRHEAFYRLSACRREAGNPAGAVRPLLRAVELDPDTGRVSSSLVVAAARAFEEGRTDEAATFADRLGEVAGAPVESVIARGEIELGLGDAAAALGAFRQALDEDETRLRAARGEAAALLLQGEDGDARAALEAALRRHPGDPALALLLVRVLAASTVDAVRDGDLALSIASSLERALPSPLHSEAMALARAEQGELDLAVEKQMRALESLAESGSEGDEALERALRSRLAVFEAGRAWRGTGAELYTSVVP